MSSQVLIAPRSSFMIPLVLKKKPEEIVLKVKDIKSYAPNLNVDWVKIINDRVLHSAKVTEEDEVVLLLPNTFKSMSSAIGSIDQGFDSFTQFSV